jgi:hypothetical protein
MRMKTLILVKGATKILHIALIAVVIVHSGKSVFSIVLQEEAGKNPESYMLYIRIRQVMESLYFTSVCICPL